MGEMDAATRKDKQEPLLKTEIISKSRFLAHYILSWGTWFCYEELRRSFAFGFIFSRIRNSFTVTCVKWGENTGRYFSPWFIYVLTLPVTQKVLIVAD